MEILTSLPFEDLTMKPPISGRVRVSDDFQQTLALLSAFDKSSRRLVFCSPTGVLYSASAPVQAILNKTSSGATEDYQWPDIMTTEVIIRANVKNTGDVWLNIGLAAAVDTGYLLATGDWINLSINNLRSLHTHTITSGDKIIVIYTK